MKNFYFHPPIAVARQGLLYLFPSVITLALVCFLWEVYVSISATPDYILPPPSSIFRELMTNPETYASEGGITLLEAVAGFILGTTMAIGAAIIMSHSRFLERSFLPLAILVKVTPIIAVAPLFVIWFGFGPMPKILIAALMSFFPALVNGVTGFRAIDPGVLDFLKSLDASSQEIFFKARLQYALPYLFAAFKVSIPLSIIGAVVGEWFSGDQGLGSTIIVAHHNLDMPTLFAAILTLGFIGVMLNILLSMLEKKVLFWHSSTISM